MTQHLHVLTNSELEAFRACPQLWGFRYVERLRPRVEASALALGRCLHAGLAAGYRAWPDGPETTLQAAQAGAREALRAWQADVLRAGRIEAERLDQMAKEAEETERLAEFMVDNFFCEMAAEDHGDLIPILVEQPFEVATEDVMGRDTAVRLAGVMDLVSFSLRYGDVVLDEHKTSVGVPQDMDRRLEMDSQTTGYVYALSRLARYGERRDGKRVFPIADALARAAGRYESHTRERLLDEARRWQRPQTTGVGRVRFNVLRKKIPTQPNVNQDGKVSTAAIDTLPEIYRAALAAQEGDRGIAITEKQTALLERLEAKGNTFCGRREYHRTAAELERWLHEVRTDAARIRSAGRQPSERTRNPGHCTMPWSMPCRYRSVCLDPQATEIREREYTVDTETHPEVAEARGELEQQHETAPEEEFGW